LREGGAAMFNSEQGIILKNAWIKYVKEIYDKKVTHIEEQRMIDEYVPINVKTRISVLVPEHYQDKTPNALMHMIGIANAFVAITIKLGLFQENKLDYEWYVPNLEQLIAQIVHDVKVQITLENNTHIVPFA
jgi:hypothetical protein